MIDKKLIFQDYSPPEIRRGKVWAVEFYYKDSGGHVHRFRCRSGERWGIVGNAGTVKSAAERKLYFSELCKAISAKLATGYDPTRKEQPQAGATVAEVVALFVADKARTLRPKTVKDYRTRTAYFCRYLERERIAAKPLRSISYQDVVNFFRQHPDWSNTTAANYRRIMVNVWNYADKHLDIQAPKHFERIETGRKVTRSNIAYPPELQKKVLEYLRENEPDLFLFVCFEYYCYFRPSEIAALNWSDINLKRRTATVWSYNSKNGKAKTNPLHSDFVRILKRYTDDRAGAIFPHPTNAAEHYKRRYSRLKKKIGIPSGYTLYSWKHTGCAALYEQTKDIYLICRLCGHHSIEVTANYLRSLGLQIGFDKIDKLPPLLPDGRRTGATEKDIRGNVRDISERYGT